MSGYTKLFGSILASTVWDLPLATKVVWITMLAMADRHGEVQASVPGLAKFAGVTREECEAALAAFLAPDPDSRTKESDGRRIEVVDGGWRLINHEKYSRQLSAEDKRERDAERQRRHRDKEAKRDMSRDVTGDHASHDTQTQTQHKTQTQTETTDRKQISLAPLGVPAVDRDFSAFWSAYPRKKSKGDAEKAWKLRRPPLALVLQALSWQRASPDWTKDGGSYVPYPASYINAKSWEDEPAETPRTAPATQKIFEVGANWMAMKEAAENGK